MAIGNRKKKDRCFLKKWQKTGIKSLDELLRFIKGYVENIKRNKNEARNWLGYARNRNSDNTSSIGYVRKYISKAGVPLKAIGTSEEELRELLFDGYIAEARKWLGYARNRNSDNTSEIGYVRKYISKAGVSLEAIGTSEEELRELLFLAA